MRDRTARLPRIIEGRSPISQNINAIALCLLEPSEFFSEGILVSFYYDKENFEQLIGFGEVVNVQDNKIIQAEMIYIFRRYEDIVEKIVNNNFKCLKQIRIKPSIPKKYLSDLWREG